MALSLPKLLSDHPSLVGIIRFPGCTFETQEVPIPLILRNIITGEGFTNVIQIVDMATSIIGQPVSSSSYTIPKTKITDFYPYTYYVLTDGESEPLIMQPQYLDSALSIKGVFSLSNQPIERYYPSSYKGDTSGSIYNITNSNQMMLPTATNEGISYMNANANATMQGRKNQITGNILNAVNVVASAITTGGASLIGGGVPNVINGLNAIKETDSRVKDIEMTPSTISSFGTPSTRKAFNTDKVRLIRYSIKQEVKDKINNFTDRYGNKYNSYASIDIKTYKGYLKMISPNLDTKIDNVYIDKIISILERGVMIE